MMCSFFGKLDYCINCNKLDLQTMTTTTTTTAVATTTTNQTQQQTKHTHTHTHTRDMFPWILWPYDPLLQTSLIAARDL